jgi:transposase-like protein
MVGLVSKLLSLDELFKGRHFDAEIMVLCVRWYLQYKLSSRDLAEMMPERRISVAPSTILRWVQRYAPEFEKRWNRFARPVGGSWRVDETYVKIRGRWTYLYRAVDARGKTVDFRLSPKRDVPAAKAFSRKAFKAHGRVGRAMTNYLNARKIFDHPRFAQPLRVQLREHAEHVIEGTRIKHIMGLVSLRTVAPA